MNKIIRRHELASDIKVRLRQEAEDIVRRKMALSKQALKEMPASAVRALVQELQAYQIELEMQNETLRQTQYLLEEMRANYFDLYNLAPISYCTVDEAGVILQANLATSELLTELRSNMVGQRITGYIHKEFQDIYYLCQKRSLATGTQQHCKLRMVKVEEGNQSYVDESAALWVNLSMVSAKVRSGNMVQRMVLSEITDAKIIALAMQESGSRLRLVVNSIH
ncbi:MAG: hypothetical protein ABL923_14590 [Burkholderiaceae bacterium]